MLSLDAKYLFSGTALLMLDTSQSSNNLDAMSDQRKFLVFYTKSHRQRMKSSYRKFKIFERKTYKEREFHFRPAIQDAYMEEGVGLKQKKGP